MTLTWNGHSCFTLDTGAGRAVFDPYEPGSVPGWTLPPLAAEAVLCSHGHHDHCHAAGVKQTRMAPGFTVETVDCWHDEVHGAKRGSNIIHIVTAEGKRFVHLGDLGHTLTAEQAAAVGRPEVLMIPVGGYYTIDAPTAKALCDRLRPRLIVPMHYRGDGFGYAEIETVEPFLRLFPVQQVHHIPGSTLDLDTAADGVWVFDRAVQGEA